MSATFHALQDELMAFSLKNSGGATRILYVTKQDAAQVRARLISRYGCTLAQVMRVRVMSMDSLKKGSDET